MMKRGQWVYGIILAGVVVLSGSVNAQVTSALWGVSGEAWDPTNSLLKDFTDVGYMNGDEPIPDWPVGVNVTNFGAVADDGIDDSQAFIDAIAACPSNHAVFVPAGRYRIEQRIAPERSNFVLRGAGMFETVLFYPKYSNEIYINQIGYDPENPDQRNTGEDPMILLHGTQQGIEDLSIEFREQIKMGHWEHIGADAIRVTNRDNWVRNLCIKNADHGIAAKGRNNSFVNLIFDQYIDRNKVSIEMEGSTVGHMAINMNDTSYNLYHNILMTAHWSHEFDIKSARHNVISHARTYKDCVVYHGMGAVGNLYSDLEAVTPYVANVGDSESHNSEIFWRLYSPAGDLYPESVQTVYDQVPDRDYVFVGYGADAQILPTKTGEGFWYEALDPVELSPQNIYLAQMAYRGKPVPAIPPMEAPGLPDGDVIRIEPFEEGTPGRNSLDRFYKFDLSGLNLNSIDRVRLRVTAKSFNNLPVEFAVLPVSDDSWAADEVEEQPPATGEPLDSMQNDSDASFLQMMFDVTPFVQAEWAGDRIVSLNLHKAGGNGFLTRLQNMGDGFGPQLIIEQVPSPVPDAPSAPAGLRSHSLIGNIRLDWADNPESDVVTYNVYRSESPETFSGRMKGHPVGMGLDTSDFVDTQYWSNWKVGMMPSDVVVYYLVTAVDSHGYESPVSTMAVATTLDPSNSPPAFSAGPHSLPDAVTETAYSASLAGMVTDPESDPLYFFKVSGPDWLNVALDGTLSGMPPFSGTGTYETVIQVNSFGGRDEAVFSLTVDRPADDPPGAPAAPTGLSAAVDSNFVRLDWNSSTEADLAAYHIYRSTASGIYGSSLATVVGSNTFVDSTVTNGTTYYYVVTAIDSNHNESDAGSEVPATPADMPPTPPAGLAAEAGNGSVRLDWADNIEGDLAGYKIYRSTSSGSYGAALATKGADSDYVDLTALNGITYYYAVTATDTNGSESARSAEVSATPDESIITVTAFLGREVSGAADNYLSNPDNWDNGLPVGRLGTISTNANCGNATLVNFTVTQIAGDITLGGYPQTSITFDGGSWTMNGGSINCRAHTYKNGHIFTLNEGALITQNNSYMTAEGSGSRLIVNGGSVSADRGIKVVAGGEITFNGGTINSDTNDAFGAYGFNGRGTMNFNGGTLTAGRFTFQGTTLATFGGATAGDATFVNWGNDDNADRHKDAVISIDFLEGTQMALTMGDATRALVLGGNTNSNAWAQALWESDQLLYDGSSSTDLGSLSWADATNSTIGIGTNVYFKFTPAGAYGGTLYLAGSALPLRPPAGLAATPDDGQVSLEWNDTVSDDFASYSLYRSTTSGSYGSALISNLTSSAYVDTAVDNGTTYYYVVTAIKTNGLESSPSAEVSATPADITAPTAPTGLTAARGNGQLSLDWEDNSEEDIDTYSVYRATTSDGYSDALVTNLTSSSYVDTSAVNDTTYYYVVTAIDTSGNESDPSEEVFETPSEPTGGYADWLSLYGVPDTSENFYEYAMDGDPTDGQPPVNNPALVWVGGSLYYVYPQRTDDETLTYTVETTTSLPDSESWGTGGTTEAGTSGPAGTLSYVSNLVDTAESERFIRLKIEQ